MPELIDKQAALDIAMSYCPDDDGCCSKACHDLREMLDEIEALPIVHIDDRAFKIQNAIQAAKPSRTVEITFVRHGRWENGECTNCKHNLIELCGGEDYELARYAEFDAEFCPFCGARMDATEEGGKQE